MDITNSMRKYVECASAGAITEPTGGSWISALALWQGSTEPLNASWLQRVCDNFGITQPVDGSWLIALSFYYERFAPVNGSWSYAIQVGCEAGPPPPTDLIWDLTTSEWQAEETAWNVEVAPMTPTFDQDGQSLTTPTPTLTGTADPLVEIDLNIDGTMYETVADALGAWSITTNALVGTPTGTEYTITIISKDLSNGLISAEFQGNIFIIASEAEVEFILNTSWSLMWVYSWIEVQQETSPGVWTSIEYDGNPTFANLTKQYKVDAGPYGATPGIYGMNYYNNDDAGTVNVVRTITLTQGTTYRIIGNSITDGTNYGQYTQYSVFQAGSQILPNFVGSQADYNQSNPVVQQTFTIT